MFPNTTKPKPKPDPKNVRDLKLAYDTCGKSDGNIEYRNMGGKEVGEVSARMLRVIPSVYANTVSVVVQDDVITEIHENGWRSIRSGCEWSKEYTFDEFRESPFWDMTLDEWGKYYRTRWDTSKIDDHEVEDGDGDYLWMYGHVYERAESSGCNYLKKTGNIHSISAYLQVNGNLELKLEGECFWDGDVHELARIIDEHEQMQEQLKKLKEHGIDLDDGTLSIKLWE